MAVPHTLEDTLRNHDTAIIRWLAGLTINYGDAGGILSSAQNGVPILRRFAAPSRAGAAVLDLLLKLGWIVLTGTLSERRAQKASWVTKLKKEGLSVLPLPLATITRGDPMQDTEWVNPPYQFRTEDQDPLTGKYKIYPFPGHYKTDYTVNFWCARRYSEIYIREWVMSQFGHRGLAANEATIEVEHEDPWGTLDQSLKFSSSSDLSALEGPDPRYLRFEFIFSLRTWLFRPYIEPPVEPIEIVQVPPAMVDDTFGVTDADGASIALSMPPLTNNLFHTPLAGGRIDNLWPKEGNATVTQGTLMPEEL